MLCCKNTKLCSGFSASFSKPGQNSRNVQHVQKHNGRDKDKLQNQKREYNDVQEQAGLAYSQARTILISETRGIWHDAVKERFILGLASLATLEEFAKMASLPLSIASMLLPDFWLSSFRHTPTSQDVRPSQAEASSATRNPIK